MKQVIIGIFFAVLGGVSASALNRHGVTSAKCKCPAHTAGREIADRFFLAGICAMKNAIYIVGTRLYLIYTRLYLKGDFSIHSYSYQNPLLVHAVPVGG